MNKHEEKQWEADAERKFWSEIRRALLIGVNAIEIRLDIKPRSTELRKFVKAWMSEKKR